MTFHDDGRLTHVVHSLKKDEVMPRVYKASGDELIHGPSRAPRQNIGRSFGSTNKADSFLTTQDS